MDKNEMSDVLKQLANGVEDTIAQAVRRGFSTGLMQAMNESHITNPTKAAPHANKAAPKKAAGAAKNVSNSKTPCVVPDCGKAAVAKNLCAGHYRKANRLKIKGPDFNESALKTLAEDGRTTRYLNRQTA